MTSRPIKQMLSTPLDNSVDSSSHVDPGSSENEPLPDDLFESDICDAQPSSAPRATETCKPGNNSSPVTLWLRRTDQFLLGFLLIALLVLLIAFRWKLSGAGRNEIEIVSQQPREYFYSIDINNASWVEWAQLDGIGEKLGRRIVEDRAERGPFQSIDDIRRVRGLGPKLIEKLRPFLKCATDNRGESKDVFGRIKGPH